MTYFPHLGIVYKDLDQVGKHGKSLKKGFSHHFSLEHGLPLVGDIPTRLARCVDANGNYKAQR